MGLFKKERKVLEDATEAVTNGFSLLNVAVVVAIAVSVTALVLAVRK